MSEIPKELQKYVETKFPGNKMGIDYIVTEYNQVRKDHFLTLDFGDGEVVELTVRERKGDNGHYRVTGMD